MVLTNSDFDAIAFRKFYAPLTEARISHEFRMNGMVNTLTKEGSPQGDADDVDRWFDAEVDYMNFMFERMGVDGMRLEQALSDGVITDDEFHNLDGFFGDIAEEMNNDAQTLTNIADILDTEYGTSRYSTKAKSLYNRQVTTFDKNAPEDDVERDLAPIDDSETMSQRRDAEREREREVVDGLPIPYKRRARHRGFGM